MIARLKELLFENRSHRQTVVKNVFWLSLSQVASRLLRAVIIIYAARVLGAAEYGVFSYALGLAGFFTVFADVGINNILTREVVQKPDRADSYFSTAFWIKTILLLFTAVVVVFVAPYFSNIEKANLLIPFVALLVIFDGLREFSIAFFRAKEKMELEALAVILTNIAIVVFGFAALYISTTSQSLTISYISSAGVGALAAIIILRKEFLKIISHFDAGLVRPVVSAAWPIAMIATLGAFMLNTDIVMLGWWREAEDIGFYSASQKIVQILYTLPAIVASAFFPIISRLAGKNNEKVKFVMEKGIAATFLIATPLIAGGVILGKPIIGFIYGAEYLPAAPVLQILIVAIAAVFPGAMIANLILAYNKQKEVVGYAALGSLGNIALNALLIPPYGIIGSAVATIGAQSLYNGLMWRKAKRINNFQILRHLKKIIAAAIIMGISSFFFNEAGLNVMVNIIVSAGIYFSALYLLREKILLEEILTLLKRIK